MQKNNNRLLFQYAGFATQLLVLLALAVWGGIKLDARFNFAIPILVWVLPLIVLVAVIIKTIKDTSKKN